MFQRILVAIDHSQRGQTVFEEALTLAKAVGANLMLLHVLSSEEEGSPYISTVGIEYYSTMTGGVAEKYQKEWANYEQRGLELLQRLAERATAAGITVEFTQNFGSPGRTICSMARNWGADLIIIGRRGNFGLNELLLGSVSNYVLHHAPCSVLTIQGTNAAVPGEPVQQGAGLQSP